MDDGSFDKNPLPDMLNQDSQLDMNANITPRRSNVALKRHRQLSSGHLLRKLGHDIPAHILRVPCLSSELQDHFAEFVSHPRTVDCLGDGESVLVLFLFWSSVLWEEKRTYPAVGYGVFFEIAAFAKIKRVD
ncbi:MAG: hypothetical protein Q9169_005596 [Polycauliona sp. 2 TL-2023]